MELLTRRSADCLTRQAKFEPIGLLVVRYSVFNDAIVQIRWERGNLEPIRVADICESSAFMDDDVVAMLTQKSNHFPYFFYAIIRISAEPKNRAACFEFLWRVRKILIEPIENLSQYHPFVGA